LESLLQSLKNGQVNAGYRGELVARILLMMAWDACCLISLPEDQLLSSGVFLKAVSLVQFLDSLFCLDEKIMSGLKTVFDNGENRAWVRCSHFIKIDYVPNTTQLVQLFRRGAAAVTKELQAGTDLVIPIVFCQNHKTKIDERMVSCVFVQVKNLKDLDAGYPETATTLQTPEATGIQIAEGLPHLSLYMSLGPRLTAAGAHFETPEIRVHCLRSALSQVVYKCLDSETLRLLLHINQGWIDPINLQERTDNIPLLANMLPCQHAPI
jgi:hypothetical protein